MRLHIDLIKCRFDRLLLRRQPIKCTAKIVFIETLQIKNVADRMLRGALDLLLKLG